MKRKFRNRKLSTYLELKRINSLRQKYLSEIKWLEYKISDYKEHDYWEHYANDFYESGYESEGLFNLYYTPPEQKVKDCKLEINELFKKLKILKVKLKKAQRNHQINCENHEKRRNKKK